MNLELLPFRNFLYAASSHGVIITGTLQIFSGLYYERDQVLDTVLEVCASRAEHYGKPWDPFNINVVFKPL